MNRRVVLIAAAYALAAHRAPASAETPATVPRYALTVAVRDGAMTVDGTVRFPHRAADGEEHVLLNDRMHDFAVDLVASDGTRTRATVRTEARTADGVRYTIAVPPGETTPLLHVRYRGDGAPRLVYALSKDVAFGAGVDSAWYPQSPDGALGIGDIVFTVPPGFVVASGGRDSATADEHRRGTFRFTNTVPTRFSFAAARYTIVRTHLGTEALSAYLLRPRRHAIRDLRRCARILAFLEKQFGPHRYGHFDLIEVPDALAASAGFSGASVEGAIFATSSFLDRPFNTAFYGHELSHQWWGNLVTVRGARGSYMLDEAMAQYGSLQAVRAFDGDAAATRYARTGYPGYISSQDAQGYLELAAAGLDHPLDDLAHAPAVAHTLADSTGFLGLDLLARDVGRSRFRTNLAQFTREHAFEAVRWETFASAAVAGSRVDRFAFEKQWFARTGAPTFALRSRRTAAGTRLIVEQTQPTYAENLPVLLVGVRGERRTLVVHVAGLRTIEDVPTAFRVATATLDPAYEVLRWTPALRRRAFARAALTRAVAAYAAGDDPAAARLLTRIGPPADDAYAVGFGVDYFSARLAERRGALLRSCALFARAVRRSSVDPDLLAYAYLHLAQDRLTLHHFAGANSAAAAALRADAATPGGAGITSQADAVVRAVASRARTIN
jgi:hypothetical protein